MPGITLFEWPVMDLRTAIMNYIQQRRTFASVNAETGTLTLNVKAWLWVRSRAEYRYTIRLETDLGPSGNSPIKSYLAQKEAIGSVVRWRTASDQAPIEKAMQSVLDDLLLQIEEDAGLYGGKKPT
ncbi:hypothetical protein [Petrachloros mirabilis]|jgi:hypothetical protein